MATRLVRTRLVRLVIAYVRASGHADDAWFERVGVPSEAASLDDLTVPLPRLHAFLDAAEEVTGDPFLGVHLAERMPRGVFGTVEYVGRNAPTLDALFRQAVRYGSLISDSLVFRFDEGTSASSVRCHVTGEPMAHGRHASELVVAVGLRIAREVAAFAWSPDEVVLAHPRPARVDELARFFGTRNLVFGRGYNALVISNDVLRRPIASADPALHSLLEEKARDEVARKSPPTFLEEVKARVQEALQDGAPKLDRVAARLAMSTRSLQRRLTDEGLSFHELVETVRRDLALGYLAKGGMTYPEIAYVLGFADMSAFYRAFKRWTATTPAQYQREQRGAGGGEEAAGRRGPKADRRRRAPRG